MFAYIHTFVSFKFFLFSRFVICEAVDLPRCLRQKRGGEKKHELRDIHNIKYLKDDSTVNGFFQQSFLFFIPKGRDFMRLRRERVAGSNFFYRVTVFGDVACVVLFQSRKDHLCLASHSGSLLILSLSLIKLNKFCGTESYPGILAPL